MCSDHVPYSPVLVVFREYPYSPAFYISAGTVEEWDAMEEPAKSSDVFYRTALNALSVDTGSDGKIAVCRGRVFPRIAGGFFFRVQLEDDSGLYSDAEDRLREKQRRYRARAV